MPYELKNTKVATIPIIVRDGDGDIVGAPAGDVFTVVSSDPSRLDASMGADASGAPAVVLRPMVRAATGLSISVSDSAGLEVDVQDVDIVADLTPKAVGLNLAGATETDQPEPAA